MNLLNDAEAAWAATVKEYPAIAGTLRRAARVDLDELKADLWENRKALGSERAGRIEAAWRDWYSEHVGRVAERHAAMSEAYTVKVDQSKRKRRGRMIELACDVLALCQKGPRPVEAIRRNLATSQRQMRAALLLLRMNGLVRVTGHMVEDRSDAAFARSWLYAERNAWLADDAEAVEPWRHWFDEHGAKRRDVRHVPRAPMLD